MSSALRETPIRLGGECTILDNQVMVGERPGTGLQQTGNHTSIYLKM